jgi:hypothetical protein
MGTADEEVAGAERAYDLRSARDERNHAFGLSIDHLAQMLLLDNDGNQKPDSLELLHWFDHGRRCAPDGSASMTPRRRYGQEAARRRSLHPHLPQITTSRCGLEEVRPHTRS